MVWRRVKCFFLGHCLQTTVWNGYYITDCKRCRKILTFLLTLQEAQFNLNTEEWFHFEQSRVA